MSEEIPRAEPVEEAEEAEEEVPEADSAEAGEAPRPSEEVDGPEEPPEEDGSPNASAEEKARAWAERRTGASGEPSPAAEMPDEPGPEERAAGEPPAGGRSRITFREALERFHDVREALVGEVRKVIIGQTEVIDQVLAAILSRGHALLIGVPGLAKTLLVRTIARSLRLSFKRIQFTPDLMPADITGTDILDDEGGGKRSFRFARGPVFAHIILADEINRTPPKTQAALLEAMQERQVTVAGRNYPLPNPFFVIATQNPIEQEGTYPLPEAQLDRFMFCIHVDYPSREEEEAIIARTTAETDARPEPIAGAEDVLIAQKMLGKVQASKLMVGYAAGLVRATRPSAAEAPDVVREMVEWGSGPRGGQYLVKAAKVFAAMDGRGAVGADDIRRAALPVLRHRVAANYKARAEGESTDDLIARVLEAVPVPGVT